MKKNRVNTNQSALLLVALVFTVNFLPAQVAVNTDGSSPSTSAMLDVKSSDKGLLIPRLTTSNRLTLASTAVAGLMVYDTDKNKFFFFNGVTWDEGSTGNLWSRNGTYTYLSNSGDSVGIGTATPGRALEVKGGWRTARLSSAEAGAYLEFVASYSTDWAIGTWAGSMRISSSADEFVTSTTEYLMTLTYFKPFANNTKTLGTDTYRWSNLYSTSGNFSGAVATGDLTTTGNFTVSGTTSIGTTSPLGQLHVHTTGGFAKVFLTPAVTNDSSALFLGEDPNGNYAMYWIYNGGINQLQLKSKVNSSLYGPHISVTRQTGNVAIGGGFATGYKLSVDGKIICEELRVDMSDGWPDYVFEDQYKLMPLKQLDSFIQSNGHLPNVPAAEDIQKSGLEVGEMQRKMMEKIEELSLYIIAQQKEIDELKKQIAKNQNQ